MHDMTSDDEELADIIPLQEEIEVDWSSHISTLQSSHIRAAPLKQRLGQFERNKKSNLLPSGL